MTADDQEIGEFQNEVRDLVIKLSGAPGEMIDGKGSDAGWQEFTLAEIGQGFAFLAEKLERVQKQAAAMREALEKALRESNCDGDLCCWEWYEAARRALILDAGRDYFSREQVKPLVEALGRADEDFDILVNRRGDLAEEPRAHETLKRLKAALNHARTLGL